MAQFYLYLTIINKPRNKNPLRFLSLLVLLMLVTTGLAAAHTEIKTWVELHEIRNNLDDNYILMNNLDQDSPGYDTYNTGNGWLPPRVFDGATDVIDIGAYEFQGEPFSIGPDKNNILYVDQNVDGGNGSGNSWAHAIPELRDALAWAQDWDGETDGTLQIWVAGGKYLPTDDNTDREASFEMINNVEIYGGFAGTEDPNTFDLDDRDFEASETILSGDLDGGGPPNNTYHVFNHNDINLDNSAILDGVTIFQGRSNTSSSHTGAGMRNVNSDPVLRNVIFEDNRASYNPGGANLGFGGGLSNDGSSPVLMKVTFIDNYADRGGGIGNRNGSEPVLTNVKIMGNGARDGAGMKNESNSHAILTNVLITGNSASRNGGGIHNSGSDPILTNVTISSNVNGGLVNAGIGSATTSSILRNSIVWGNSGSDVTNFSGGFYGSNSTTIEHSIVSGEDAPENGNIDADPQFTDPENGDFTLQKTSPAINTGDPSTDLSLFPGGPSNPLDISGNPRIFYGESDVIDMGAYEFQGEPFSVGPDDNNVLYVDQNVSGGNGSGNSWENALPELRDALAWAQDWDGETDGTLQIWVADGVYLPTDDGDREASFQMINHVEIYGGFAGDEDPGGFNLADRNFEDNETILSGDIGVSDNDSDNAYHVFYHPDVTELNETAVLDGVTITAGKANGRLPRGGGMYNDNSSPTLKNVIFKNNLAHNGVSATQGGGGMYNGNSSPALTRVTFTGNEADYGGALHNRSNSNPTLTDVIISGNVAATAGGGIYNNVSHPTLINAVITGNDTESNSGGGIFNFASSPELYQVTISGNSGSGMISGSGSHPVLKNSIIWGNSDFNVGYTPFGTNSTTIEHSIVEGMDNSDNGNIDEDPLFIDPIPFSSAPTTAGNYRLLAGSPAISAGDNNILPDGITSDLAGNPRIDAILVDMGAYEFQGANLPTIPDDNNILYVDKNVEGGNGTGNSWDNAIPELRDALAWAQDWNTDEDGALQIWVAEGLYLPTDDAEDRDTSFQLVDGVQMYGGFDPNNGIISLEDDRIFPSADGATGGGGSILSGDIADDDEEDIITDPENQIVGSNSHQVIFLDGTTNPITSSTLIDGFTVTAGQENSHIRNNGGGGLRCDGSGSGGECSPTITNVTFSGNISVGFGGGMYIGTEGGKSNPILTNVVFNGNWAKGDGGSGAGFGGGIYNYGTDGESSPTLTNVIFRNNLADLEGGGMISSGGAGGQNIPALTNVLFTGNSAQNGGALNNGNQSNLSLVNVTFSGNHAEDSGGAIYNRSKMTITNSILWGNTAKSKANDFFNAASGNADVFYSTISFGESKDVTSAGSLSCNNCSKLDPLLTDPNNGNFSLSSKSPAINAGDNSAIPTGIITDLAGNPRIYDGTADPDIVDMGAYEFQGDPDEIPQGKDKRLLVGNQKPYTFKSSDFSINDSVDKVRIIGIVGYGSVLVDGADYSLFEKIPVEDITGGLLTFQHSDAVSYGYNYMKLEFQLIDDVGRESETATIFIDLAAASVTLNGDKGWRFLGNPSNGDSYEDLLGPIWTKGMAGSDFPGALFPNVNILNQEKYQWESPSDLGSTTEAGQPFIVYVYSDNDNDGSDDGFPKKLTSSSMEWLPLDGDFSYDELGYGESVSNPNNFYLIANPHPISLDFCKFTSANIGTAATFWNPSANSGNGDYLSLNCGTLDELPIAPFQAFWIRSTDANPALKIPEAAYMETVTEDYLKEPDVRENLFRIAMDVSSESSKQVFSNRTELYFTEDAATDLDELDAPKLSPAGLTDHWLSFYSLDQNNKAYAFQSLPFNALEREGKITIPLNIQTTESGRFTLNWSLPETHVFGGSYFLRDNHTSQVIELREGANYSFEIASTQKLSKGSEPLEGSGKERSAKSSRDVADLGKAVIQPSSRSDNSGARFELLIAAAGVDGMTELGAVPEEFNLSQNYPNPFNPTTVIRYQLPASSHVQLEVYDMLGRNVATIVNSQVSAGRHSVNFDASNLSSGIYLYRLQAGTQIITRKLTVLK